MLRITVHDAPRVLTFQLEGTVAGPWLKELERCWQDVLPSQCEPILCIDLTGVTSIDAAGQACLAGFHRQGADFIAADCLTKAVVAEITKAGDVACAAVNRESDACHTAASSVSKLGIL
jgi:ABC-type transporter Mla MlaB component